MEHSKEASIYWNHPYGWRAGSRNIEHGVSAVDVIRYEQDVYGNDLDVPDFLLDELTNKQVSAGEVVWVCRTRQHARRYSSRDTGQPYREDFDQQELVLATDQEDEKGYLVLFDATRLDPFVLDRYAQYRRAQQAQSQKPMSSRK